MKTPSAMQALTVAMALLACFTPAFGARELKNTCDCAYYQQCARVLGRDASKDCYVVDQSGCGGCGVVNLLVSLLVPPIICLKAAVGVLDCSGADCGINWGDFCNSCNGGNCPAYACPVPSIVSGSIGLCIALGK